MNKIYRLIWSKAKEKWVVVAEKVAARGCCPATTVGALTLAALLAASGAAFALDPGALPTGGTITAGSGTIATSGNQMVVNQTTPQMIANWNSFNIGQDAGVRFIQPGSTATALNRINDQNPSQILGSLSANGNVFLLNPAGIIFGQTARVDVGGIVASSLSMLDTDFLAGKYTFTNPGNAGAVLNRGTINAMPGGVVALIAPRVTNEGAITAGGGSVALAAGNQVSLDFTGDGLITYTVDKGAVDALAENKGLIRADGGLVVMTAKAADALTGAVVNNSGVIEARTLQEKAGRILLLSDMEHGQTVVGGTLDASAPQGGDGGFVETSGGRVKVGDGAKVDTRAAQGKTGMWLLDPTDFTIGVDESGASVSDSLATTNRTIQADNSISVNENVAWNANTLTLQTTGGDININAVMTAGALDTSGTPGTYAALDLEPGSGKVNVGMTPDGLGFTGRVDFLQSDGVTPRSGSGFLTVNGNPYTVITDLTDPALVGTGSEHTSTTGTDLQGINGNLSGYYALGANIDAGATAGWDGGAGFLPIGTYGAFTGTFDGLGHTVSNLTVNRPGSNNQGLFGAAYYGTLRNVGLPNLNVTGYGKVGGLVGYGWYTTISNSFATGTVSAGNYATGVGGLLGYDYGGSTITNSHASVTVTAGDNTRGVGGLVGYGLGYGSGIVITGSSAAGAVTAGTYSSSIGGLVGYTYGGSITDSNASGAVTAGTYSSNVGGLVGYNDRNSRIDNSYATGPVTGSNYVGGLVGYDNGNTITNSHADGTVTAGDYSSHIGGLVGYGWYSAISGSYAAGAITAGYGSQNVGGLVGYLYGNGSSITASSATGAVSTGNASSNVGGLVGRNDGGSITGSHATGNVSAGSYSDSVGGLVGNNYTAGYGITTSYATGMVTADGTSSQNIGGLVGNNNGNSPIDSSYATGPVTGNSYVGGLVGYDNGNTIANSHAAGAVSGASNVGGLVGYGNTSTITNSYATGAVTADASNGQNIGGLVGYGFDITITDSHATGAVTGNSNVGGLVGDIRSGGYGSSLVSRSYATGTVTAGAYGTNIGGLVGNSYAYGYGNTITTSYATGAVTGDATNSSTVGGLVGNNGSNSSIDNSYATGPVTGNGYVGGLIGFDNGNTITNTLAAGAVTGSSYVGGVVGYGSGSSINASFWDRTVNTNLALDNGFGTGKTTGELKTLSTFAGAGWDIDASGGTGTVWRIYDGTTMPLLRSFLTPLTITAADAGKTYNGQAYSSTTAYTTDPAGADTGKIFGSVGSSGTNVGTYAISAAGLYSTQDGYDITAVDGTLTVTPAPLTVTASDVVKSYGQTPTLTAFTSSGLQNGETIGSVTLASAGTAATAVVSGSPYAITAGTATGGTFSAGNYTITYADGALTVTPASLTVTASDVVKSYGQTPTLTGFTSSGLQNGETIGSVTLASAGTAATAGVSGTPYAITAGSATGGTFNAGNYTITYTDGALTVTPAPLTVTASDDARTYTGIPYAGGNGVVFTGFVNGEGDSVLGGTLSYGGTSQGAVGAGSYTITPTGLTGGNYRITFVDGTLTITGGPTPGGTTAASPDEPIQVPPPSPHIADPRRQLGPSAEPPPPVVDLTTAGGRGTIVVTVPATPARSGPGFSFLLPEEIATAVAAGTVTEKVSLPDGSPLPAWLHYSPDTRRFVASEVPAGSLPLFVVVSVGERRWVVEIAPQQERPL